MSRLSTALANCSDSSFGPGSCSRDFDFTLTFEQSILSILPSALLILVAPVRLFQLFGKHSETVKNKRNIPKITTAAAIVALQLSLLILWAVAPFSTQTSLPSAALAFVDALIVLFLSYVEDRRSPRPSTTLNIYLLFAIVFDATQVRTLWLTGQTNVAAVLTALVGVKTLMLTLEAQSKISDMKPPYNNLPPEATSGIINLSFFWWINSLFRMGFKKLITTEDLFDMDPSLKADVLGKGMQDVWNKYAMSKGQMALPKAVLYFLRWNLLAAAIPRLGMIGFGFAQPFLITAAIHHVEKTGFRDKNVEYGLIGATFLIYFGIAISTVHYRRCFARTVAKFRGSMISLLYNRSLTLQHHLCTESAVLTLMSTDVDNIIDLMENIIDVWARVVEIGIGIWLLERQIGAVCVTPIIVTAICALGQLWVAKSIGIDQQKWNEAIQQRVRDVSAMLGSMKAIKIAGLARQVTRNVQGQRERELYVARAFFKGIMWLNGLANLPAIWSPVISFIVFSIQARINGSESLTTVRAFTSLSIISLVTSPTEKLLAVLPQIAATLGCFQRLHEYLLSDDRNDTRVYKPTMGSPFADGEGESSDPDGSSVLANAIEVENATVLPSPKSSSPAIVDASFTVETGSLTILLGPIGCGKSTLLMAMLGEIPCSSGSISITSKKISICSQTPWLLNTSIRGSICDLGATEFDESWYETVVEACALDEDIRHWPKGDRTIIGSKGLTLSGGQKQRVALARAIYARQDIALLDDILSALDMETQEHIASRLFSKSGLFRRLGTTVILSTHTARCTHLADKIVILDGEGKVSMVSSYENMRQQNVLEKFAPAKNDEQSDSKQFPDDNTKAKPDTAGAKDPRSLEHMDMARRTGDMSVYSYYFRTIHPAVWVAFLVIHLVAAFSDSFPQVWLNWWTSFGGPLAMRLSVYAALALSASIFSVLCIWIIFLKIMPESAVLLHKRILEVVMRAPLSFFAETETGVTLNRFSQDMSLVDLALPGALLTVTASLLHCVARLALISVGSSYMAISIPFTVIAVIMIQHVYLKTSRQLRFLDLENKSPLYSHFLETLEGLPTIRALMWQVPAKKMHVNYLDFAQRPYYLLLCIQRWLSLVLDLMVAALAVIVMTLAMELRSTTSGGLIGVALNNVLSFNQSLSTFVTAWTSLETSLGAIARVKTFSKITPNENQADETDKPPEGWPRVGTIEIDDVSVQYANGTCALSNLSLTISKGQKIGICGRTGSGKSSLILSLLRLVDITSGKIQIDDVDITTISREDLRERLISIPQDPFILSGTIRNNADPLGHSSDEDIVSALQRIGIWETLQSRGGLDAVLLDHPLSQGQQQLFCLARAMLRKTDSKILILDEATSSVDSNTDAVMQKVIKEEFAGYTIISVAHRLDTIIDSDKVAVLDSGSLVEFDSPENLLARDSVFKRMYQK
ncbi:putative multidrug resistance protein [Aspergillus avenaceus]|uniref:Putative multidrug resistance protein n=1 Tax=Aspergillus avenaceus TaxID=36643 RepID=A0A5N6U0Y6_ASPAV|nr:putative multidrug resistance protein [Aspergillus avenaceus]